MAGGKDSPERAIQGIGATDGGRRGWRMADLSVAAVVSSVHIEREGGSGCSRGARGVSASF